MKKTPFLLSTLVLAATLAAASAQAQMFTVGYNFANSPGANGGQVAGPVDATATDPSLTLSGIDRDHGYGPNQYLPNFTNYSFGVNPAAGNVTPVYMTTAVNAHNAAEDINFVLSPLQAISLTSLSFGVGIQNGDGTGALGYSTDGGVTFNFLTPTTVTGATTGNAQGTPSVGTYDFSTNLDLQAITTPVVFELYLLSNSQAPYQDGDYFQPGTTTLDVAVNGFVVPAAGVPEPGTWAMMIVGAGLLLGVYRARRVA